MKKIFLVLMLLVSQGVIADASYRGHSSLNIVNPGWATWWPTPEEAGQTFYDYDRANNPNDCLWTAMRINYGDNPPTVRYESYSGCTSTLKQWAQFLYVDWCPDGELNNTYTGSCEPIAPIESYSINKNDFIVQVNDANVNSCPPIYTSKPINTSDGNKYRQETDYTSAGITPLTFIRYYSSNKKKSTDVGVNWRHSYSSSLTENIHTQDLPYFSNSSDFSSQYSSAQVACESGWNEIKGQYTQSTLANTTAVFESGTCSVKDGASLFGSISVRSENGLSLNPPQDTVIIERANGNTITFVGASAIWVSPVDADVSLVQTTTDYTLTTAQDTVEQYNLAGQLVSITDRKGIQQTLTYNATTGLLEKVTDSFGQSLGFTYSGTKLTSVSLPDTTQLVYTYDTNNNFSSVKREDNTVKTYVYEDARFPNALTGIIDENNQRYMTFSYDAQGRATTSELAGGADKVTVNFIDDVTSTVTDALGQLRTYRFSTINDEKRLTDIEGAPCTSCGGQSSHYTYDANGHVNSSTDFNGSITSYTNNARGLALSRIEASGTKDERTTYYEWHPTYALPTCIIESNKTTRLSYTANGSLETRTAFDTGDAALFVTPASKACSAIEARGDYASLNKRSTGYTYYPDFGLVKSIDGARTDINDVTAFTYDTFGNLSTITNALGHVTYLNNYTLRGQPQEMIDANGLVTTLTYDARGRIDLVTVGNLTTDYDFDAVGNLDKVTQPDGSFIDYDYDAAHRLTDIRDQVGNHIHYSLDALGNRTATVINDAGANLKRTSTAIYNQLGQLSKTIGAATQATDYLLYDNNGNLKQVRDAESKNTYFGYDALDRLETTTNELNNTSTTTYDAQDNITSVTDLRGLVTGYTYDGLANRTEQNSPDTGITQYLAHDGNGNVLTMVDASLQSTSYSYDALNRIDLVTYADGSTADYVYDIGSNAKGRLSSVTYTDSTGANTGSTAWTYETYGRVKSKTETVNAISLTTTYNYNPTTGQLDNVVTSGGRTISYAYLNAQLNSISIDSRSIMNTITYEPFGAANAWTWGNGQASNRVYDQDGQLDTYTIGNTTYDINYSLSGNVQTISDLSNPANNQSFNYDGLHRLKDYSNSAGNEAYNYDASSNRIGVTDITTALSDSYVIDPVSNKLTSITGTSNKTYAYNLNGSIINDGVHSYAYDARNRLISVDDNQSVYQLNALGQRVQKNAAGNITLFHYGEQGQLIAEANSQGVVTKEYIYLGNMPVAVLSVKPVNQVVDKVIDNSDNAVLVLGRWKPSTRIAGYEGSDYLYITNGLPSTSVNVDNDSPDFMKTGTWNISTLSSGFVGLDHLVYEPDVNKPGSFIIDNPQGTGTGSWVNATNVSGYEGADYQYHIAGTGLNIFTWSGLTPASGGYRVYAKWTAHSKHATNSKYIVHHVDGETSITVDQETKSATWNLLGEFNLDDTSKITLSDNANGYVIADAILIVPVNTTPNFARWTLSPPSTGNYTVYARWRINNAYGASDAKYTIQHVDGSTSVTQNQRINGGKWMPLGDFNLDTNSTVTLTEFADGKVIADAVAIAPTGLPPEQVIWQVDVNQGNYDLYAKWTTRYNHASDAPYSISHVNGESLFTANQKTNGAQWNLLGNFDFNTLSTISLSNHANGYVIADALRVVGTATSATEDSLNYIHTDHLGTPRVITDENNTTLWSWHSAPFGKTLPNEDVDGDGNNFEFNLRFAGQYYDGETGLHYNYFRDYDPSTGRYVQSDPIGLAGGLNTYGYVGGNPLSWNDPLGLATTITINRDIYTPNTISGTISATSDRVPYGFRGYTLEDKYAGDLNQKLPIPPGEYSAFLRYSRGAWRVEFEGVNGYKNIQIHAGNTTDDIKGCFAVGYLRGEDRIIGGESKDALDKIVDIIRSDGSGEITIKVIGRGY